MIILNPVQKQERKLAPALEVTVFSPAGPWEHWVEQDSGDSRGTVCSKSQTGSFQRKGVLCQQHGADPSLGAETERNFLGIREDCVKFVLTQKPQNQWAEKQNRRIGPSLSQSLAGRSNLFQSNFVGFFPPSAILLCLVTELFCFTLLLVYVD